MATFHRSPPSNADNPYIQINTTSFACARWYWHTAAGLAGEGYFAGAQVIHPREKQPSLRVRVYRLAFKVSLGTETGH